MWGGEGRRGARAFVRACVREKGGGGRQARAARPQPQRTSSRMKKGEGLQLCMAKSSARLAMLFSPPLSWLISLYFLLGGMALKMMPPLSASKGSAALHIMSLALPPLACMALAVSSLYTGSTASDTLAKARASSPLRALRTSTKRFSASATALRASSHARDTSPARASASSSRSPMRLCGVRRDSSSARRSMASAYHCARASTSLGARPLSSALMAE